MDVQHRPWVVMLSVKHKSFVEMWKGKRNFEQEKLEEDTI